MLLRKAPLPTSVRSMEIETYSKQFDRRQPEFLSKNHRHCSAQQVCHRPSQNRTKIITFSVSHCFRLRDSVPTKRTLTSWKLPLRWRGLMPPPPSMHETNVKKEKTRNGVNDGIVVQSQVLCFLGWQGSGSAMSRRTNVFTDYWQKIFQKHMYGQLRTDKTWERMAGSPWDFSPNLYWTLLRSILRWHT